MRKRDPRKMALQIAGLRANETHLRENERVFEDPYAEYFFPEEVRKMARNIDWVKAERAKYEAIMPGVNGALVARIRYIDERVSDAVRSGFGQMVVIGAGYDTRAYRIRGISEKFKVYEVDHPVTQRVKTEVIREIFGDLPAHVAYVPMVFGEDRFDEKLFEAGYDSMQKTLFVAEGLLMYIPPPAVDGLLMFIRSNSAAGSSLVADVFDTTVVDGTSPLKEAQVLRSFVATEGSPLRFGIPDGTVETFFKQRGFKTVRMTTPAQCKKSYFSAASRDRNVSPMFQFVYAAT
ncbi:SAM-dependent methyltransferase [Desulfosarcina widdelii]|uniref:S-adenosyl-L-methionine-dependent methyltransferase n=1 Tax=Desulfosarcina widdelii TaxID=947919 RepID=A0A5K7Z119_9BACT|nr:class I SAM-dependent methyltransferase [Desulfosarcina widdelii]BBO73929.1 SAM-dependent methyltransferase [Desulfosarcina widdelii]